MPKLFVVRDKPRKPETTIYLSGCVPTPGTGVRLPVRSDIGVLVQPKTMQYLRHIDEHGGRWAFDNGCFAEFKKVNPVPWDKDEWWDAVLALPRDHRRPFFVTAPDHVGDWEKTWARSKPWLEKIRQLGHLVAVVAQDGIENADIDWDAFDVLFIGGTDAWKVKGRGKELTDTVVELIAEANRRGKWTHVGRVNSGVRFDSSVESGADSADGTYLRFPRENLPKLLRWLDRAQLRLRKQRIAA